LGGAKHESCGWILGWSHTRVTWVETWVEPNTSQVGGDLSGAKHESSGWRLEWSQIHLKKYLK